MCVATEGHKSAIAIMAAVMMLAGCKLPLHLSDLKTTLAARTDAIAANRSDRVVVRQMLGEPHVMSEDWNFDLFQFSYSDSYLGIFLVPFPYFYTFHVYVLVSYDMEGKVETVATNTDEPFAHLPLKAGTIGAVLDKSDKLAALFIEGPPRDEYLAARLTSDRCTLVLGTIVTSTRVDTRKVVVEVDRKRSLRPNQIPTEHELVIPVSLAPGRHRLRIRSGLFNSLKGSSEFNCAEGDVLYSSISIDRMRDPSTEQPGIHLMTPIRASIGLSELESEPLRARPLLIWRDGGWQIPSSRRQR